MLLWLPLLGVVRLFDPDPLRRRTARWFRRAGRVVARLNPAWRVHVSGAEHIIPGQVYVVVSNHQSLADIPLISHLKLDAKWLAKSELFRVPVFGWMMRLAGDIPVDRANRAQSCTGVVAVCTISSSGLFRRFLPRRHAISFGEPAALQRGPVSACPAGEGSDTVRLSSKEPERRCPAPHGCSAPHRTSACAFWSRSYRERFAGFDSASLRDLVQAAYLRELDRLRPAHSTTHKKPRKTKRLSG